MAIALGIGAVIGLGAGAGAASAATDDDPSAAKSETRAVGAGPRRVHTHGRAKAVAAGPVATLLFNQTPSLRPTRSGQDSSGVVVGDLNLTDQDSHAVSFSVTGHPAYGSVRIDTAGAYTYTPEDVYVATGTTDSFTVSVSDEASGFHIHGLPGLINLLSFGLIGDAGHTATTTVPVFVYPASPVAGPPSVERLIYATTTDSSITAAPGSGEAPHVVINPSPTVTPKDQLVVFLPGTQGRPAQYSYILRAAAGWGFHAIGLNYPNQTAIGSLCRTSPDPGCYWSARNDVLFGDGTPVTGQTDITESDSIVNRLDKLLVSMSASSPDEGWGQFLLAGDTVDWSKVVLAGHSQGGGYVGVMAKTVSLGRAVYFSSPEDWNALTDQPAEWTLRPNITPPSRQFGFGSDADTLVPDIHAFANWDNLGLPEPTGGPVLVDDSSAPFSGSHQLHTALAYNPASTAAGTALKNHGITVVDTSTPIGAGGAPVFATNGVWSYLLGGLQSETV